MLRTIRARFTGGALVPLEPVDDRRRRRTPRRGRRPQATRALRHPGPRPRPSNRTPTTPVIPASAAGPSVSKHLQQRGSRGRSNRPGPLHRDALQATLSPRNQQNRPTKATPFDPPSPPPRRTPPPKPPARPPPPTPARVAVPPTSHHPHPRLPSPRQGHHLSPLPVGEGQGEGLPPTDWPLIPTRAGNG